MKTSAIGSIRCLERGFRGAMLPFLTGLNYSYDRYHPERGDSRVESVAIAPMNLKIGLLNDVDLQLML
jgi:hypothetical protein